MAAKKAGKKIKSLFLLSSAGCVTFGGICIYKGDERFYKDIFMPSLQKLVEPENAHNISLKLAKYGILPKSNELDLPLLKNKVWNLQFKNPVGLAGGFDKDGEAFGNLFKVGFGFIEVGSITPEAQPGNEKPRIFRLIEDNGIINRCGFNSKGHDYALNQLEKTLKSGKPNGILGVSLGKNKASEDATADYVAGVKKFGHLADYLVVNISSPNTPNLRDLQEQKKVEQLLDKVSEARNSLVGNKPVLLVKVSPDLSDEWKKGIAKVITKKGSQVDGLIVTNTTLQRPETLTSLNKNEQGGLSGLPLKDLSTNTISEMYKLTNGKIPIIGVGGIFTGKDAYDKIKAGASLVQIYTALTYEGPPVVNKIKRELNKLLEADNYTSISEAIGADHRK